MSPLGQTLESGFSIVKVLSVLEVCPLGVQVFNSNDLPVYLCGQTSTTNFMGGHVENPHHTMGMMVCVSNPSPWEVQSGGSTSDIYQV